MDIVTEVNRVLGIKDSYEAPAAMMDILYDKPKRERVFLEFLDLFDRDMSYDWFTDYFQDEHADRKNKKQDFTPRSLNQLITRMIGEDYDGTHYEPAAGTGGMTIAAWDRDRKKHSPFDYRPSWYVYTCEELSGRTVPFLLFNLIIRGMNALVVHGDVLSRKASGAFFVQNDYDDHMLFSSFNVLPYSQNVANELAVKWEEEAYRPLVESPGIPEHVLYPTPRGEVSDWTKAIYGLCGVDVIDEPKPRQELITASSPVKQPSARHEELDLVELLEQMQEKGAGK